MKKQYSFPVGVNFIYDTETRQLTLTSVAGMTCGHNGLEDDYSCSGLALVCVDEQRLEGNKLIYSIDGVSNDEFSFSSSDRENNIRMDFVWKFKPQYKLFSCNLRLTNISGREIVIRRAMPRFVFSPGEYRVMWQMNRWGAENQLQKQSLCGADIVLHGRPARSTVGTTPFCVLEDTENSSAVALHVVPRGNWMIKIHSDILSNEAPAPVIEAGLSDTDLFMRIKPGESVELPELIVQAVPAGDIKISGADLHRYILDERLGEDIKQPPVIFNTWLYRFTDFTLEQLRKQLQAAKEVGCEIFIIDAGWFGADESWGQVGDWREKETGPFAGNMAAFADEVRAAGLGFGFWIEPERWANGIPVRKEHPEWFPADSIRIDLTQSAAAEYFYDTLAGNVRKFKAGYIKVDFNASVGYEQQGDELLRYSLVLHSIFRKLRNEFPDLIIENCGSGALRNDLATLEIYDHNFVSDNANPFETLRIRQGLFMRSLPGRVLNWIVLRNAPERMTPVADFMQVMACNAGTWDEAGLFDLDYVMISGLLGIPGFSGDLAGLEPELRHEIRKYIDFYKANREFIVNSHAYLLTEPDNKITDYEKYVAFQLQNGNADKSLVFIFSNGSSRRSLRSFRLNNLDPAKNYIVERVYGSDTETVSGKELMEYGLSCRTLENQHIRHACALYSVKEI